MSPSTMSYILTGFAGSVATILNFEGYFQPRAREESTSKSLFNVTALTLSPLTISEILQGVIPPEYKLIANTFSVSTIAYAIFAGNARGIPFANQSVSEIVAGRQNPFQNTDSYRSIFPSVGVAAALVYTTGFGLTGRVVTTICGAASSFVISYLTDMQRQNE